MDGDEQATRDMGIARHADAIRALIYPDWILGILAVAEDGVPYFILPQELRPELHALLVAIRNGQIDLSGQV